MPAFYRMPVVYLLVALTGLIALGIGRRGPRAEPPISLAGATTSVTPAKPATPPAAAAGDPADGRPTDGIARTTDGIRRKVVIKTLGERCRDAPKDGKAVGPVLDYFSIHFVHGEQGTGDDAVVLIGPSHPPALGWVKRAVVFLIGTLD